MNYRFENFDCEIENPTITVDTTRLNIDTENHTISVGILLETSDSKVRGVLLNIPYSGRWQDINVDDLVADKLIEFEV